jgi:hypothetical protein
VTFPVIADLDRAVATAYGMIMPGESTTEASRCVFVIDPRSIVRAMIYYPQTIGRNMKEIIRLVDALQMADTQGVSTPANWEQGERVLLPVPKTMDELMRRIDSGLDCVDWYLCYRPATAAAAVRALPEPSATLSAIGQALLESDARAASELGSAGLGGVEPQPGASPRIIPTQGGTLQ